MGLISSYAREGMAKQILAMIEQMPDDVTKAEIVAMIQKILEGDLD